MLSDRFRTLTITLLLVDRNFLSLASSVIEPRYFESQSEQHLVRFLLEHFRQYRNNPSYTILEETIARYFHKQTSKSAQREQKEVLELLEEVKQHIKEAVLQSAFIRDQALKFAQENALKEAIIRSVDDIQAGKLDGIKKYVTDALSVGSSLKDTGLFMLADPTRESMDEIIRPVPTGLEFIDKPTRGGLGRGMLGMIMAPPNTGKTTMLVNIGAGALRKRQKVVHISAEMNRAMVRKMYDQCFLNKSGIELDKMDEDEQKTVSDYLGRINKRLNADVNIQDWPSMRLSIDDIYAHLAVLKSSHDFTPDILIVDYVAIMKRPSHIREKHEGIEYNVLELRAMAKELDIAVWSALQTNKEGMSKKTADLDDAAGSFSIGMHGDLVLGLNQTKEEAEEEVMRLFYAKTRVGKKHITIPLVTDFNKAKIMPA